MINAIVRICSRLSQGKGCIPWDTWMGEILFQERLGDGRPQLGKFSRRIFQQILREK